MALHSDVGHPETASWSSQTVRGRGREESIYIICAPLSPQCPNSWGPWLPAGLARRFCRSKASALITRSNPFFVSELGTGASNLSHFHRD